MCDSLHFYVHLLKLRRVMLLHWIARIHIIVSASSALNGLCSKSVEGEAIYRLFTKRTSRLAFFLSDNFATLVSYFRRMPRDRRDKKLEMFPPR